MNTNGNNRPSIDPIDPKNASDMDLTYRGLCQATWLKAERRRIAQTKELLEAQEDFVRELERDLERTNKELRTRKDPQGVNYHDIGHARSQFEEKLVDKHRVPLTPEELDPRVKAYLERSKQYEE